MKEFTKITPGECRNEPKTPDNCDVTRRDVVGFDCDFCNTCGLVKKTYGKTGHDKKPTEIKPKKQNKKTKEVETFVNNNPINTDVELIKNKVFVGDFREKQHLVPNKSIRLIIVDLPYGTTDAAWDNLIPFEELWAFWNRVIMDDGVILLFGDQPFLTDIINSNRQDFRYCWTWKKNNMTKHVMAKSQPMKCIEHIAVFYKTPGIFNTQIDPVNKKKSSKMGSELYNGGKDIKHDGNFDKAIAHNEFLIFPKETGLHSTQKPVALIEYFIDVYTLEGDIVLDNTAGSLTVGVACVHTKRPYVLFELLEKHANIGKKRIKEAEEKITLGFEFESKIQPKKNDKHTLKNSQQEALLLNFDV